MILDGHIHITDCEGDRGGFVERLARAEVDGGIIISLAPPAFWTESDPGSTISRLDGLFDHEIWERVSRKCLGCGACSYLCPTCYCFDLTDEKTSTGARKVRRWDCCMFPSFTLHASGHNPRPVNAPRVRQKLMHKFSYHTERHGLSSCVGCGRCVRSCPVNLDIRQLLGQLMAASDVAPEK